MLELVKRHKKKLLVTLPLAAMASYYGIKKWSKAHTVLVHAPHIVQNPELPRGCEVTSLAMLLRHAGLAVDKMDLSRQIDKVPFKENGLHGSMHDGFVGDMYCFSRPGLGVYIEPVYKLAAQYIEDGLINLSGGSPEDLYRMLDKGLPVWLITNDTFSRLPADRFETWYTSSGPMPVTYAEHSVLLTGYNQHEVFVNDPLHDAPNRPLVRKDFEQAWIQMGRQAFSCRSVAATRTTS